MNRELFGVFGDRTAFERHRSPAAFDRVIEAAELTVGIRDDSLGLANRSGTYDGDDAACVLWGEVHLPDGTDVEQARWLAERYAEEGTDALSALNGSYLAVLDDGEGAFVATDPVRSWDCYYADADVRVFGTDPVQVARTVERPGIATDPLLEFFHLGTVIGDRTVIRQLRRTPFDGLLRRDSTAPLSRFVYELREFDYAEELAIRLERAIRRRAGGPGRAGMLLSGGYDSRAVLARMGGIDECYTVGFDDGPEVAVARRIAGQYGAQHRTLPVDDRYLNTDADAIRYCHGISESLHIHQGGYDDLMGVDRMYHGLFFDTFFRGHFLPWDGVDLNGRRFPLNRLDPDPDVAETVASKFGFLDASGEIFPDCANLPDSNMEFVRDVIERKYDELSDRFDSTYNGIELFGIRNQPSTPFRLHLADNYVESFVAVDVELLDWHLTTPPEHRNTRTFLKALKLLDSNLLRHRPPDRPHDSDRLNEIERVVRSKLPFVESFDTPWPDRRELYDRANLDAELFADNPEIHSLPPRLKLRINDLTTWLGVATDGVRVTPDDVLCPPYRFPAPARVGSGTDATEAADATDAPASSD